MDKLTDLPNISQVISANLQRAGIKTPEALREIGSKDAFLRIRAHVDEDACLNQLYALEGAVRGIRWHLLPDEVKEDLKSFKRSLK